MDDHIPEAEVDVEGITQLTKTDCRTNGHGHRRSVSYTNVDLPKMTYEDALSGQEEERARAPSDRTGAEESLDVVPDRPRALSDSSVLDRAVKQSRPSTKKTLAYWRLEKELRLARDKLLAKAEECESLEQYREQLTKEMDDLTSSVFEEAHEMVRVEKRARSKAEKLLKEADFKVEVLTAEVAALKTVLENNRLLGPGGHGASNAATGSAAPSRSPDKRGGSGKRRFGLRRQKSADSVAISSMKSAAAEVAQAVVESCNNSGSSSRATTPLPANGDDPMAEPLLPSTARLLPHPDTHRRLEQWLAEPRLGLDPPLIREIVREDVVPCLPCTDAAGDLGNELVEAMQANLLEIVHVAEAEVKAAGDAVCALLGIRSPCPYIVVLYPNSAHSSDDSSSPSEPKRLQVCPQARARLVALGNVFMYLRHISQGLIKSNTLRIYWHLAELRLKVHQARLGIAVS